MSVRIALAIGGVALASLQAIPAHALLFRAYLSSTGSDVNPCTLQQPCRLLPAGLAAHQDGGEIWMLDSANYNTSTVFIAKSATILAVPGAIGSVVGTAGSSAIAIATAGISVSLRNLMLAPLPGVDSPYGVEMTNGMHLTIEGGVISRFGLAGLRVDAPAAIRINGTTFRDNQDGVRASGSSRVSISDSKFFGHPNASVFADQPTAGATRIIVSDSIFADCSTGAFATSANAGATARVMVTRSSIANCNYGAGADGSAGAASVSLSGSTLFAISVYMTYQNGVGVVESLGNNSGRHNGASFGAVTTASQF